MPALLTQGNAVKSNSLAVQAKAFSTLSNFKQMINVSHKGIPACHHKAVLYVKDLIMLLTSLLLHQLHKQFLLKTLPEMTFPYKGKQPL